MNNVLLFRVATAVAALHVADDNFLQPRAGTSAADHLVSGLTPLLALGGAAVVYPRLRAGARAAVALFIGVLTLVIGATSAGYEAMSVGPSGDDWTGLLALPAGLLLLGLGAVTLWRSRRLDDRKRWRYPRRALLAAAGLAAGAVVVFPLGLGYGATHVLRQEVPAASLGAAYEDVSFTTADGLRLEGWYVPSRNGAAVIVYPGRSGPQAQARMLARHGYGVLLFDRRGEGASEGDPNLFGWGGDGDIVAAAEFLRARPEIDDDRIGGIGLSVGGEQMLEAAAETHALDAVIADGAGARSFREDVREAHGAELALAVPLLAVKTAAVAVFSNTLPPPDLKELIPRIAPTPLLFIWSPTAPNDVHNPLYHRIAGEPKAIWAVEGAGHVAGSRERPEAYERHIVGFFDRALLHSGS